jgi:hypothetical protein
MPLKLAPALEKNAEAEDQGPIHIVRIVLVFSEFIDMQGCSLHNMCVGLSDGKLGIFCEACLKTVSNLADIAGTGSTRVPVSALIAASRSGWAGFRRPACCWWPWWCWGC